MSYRGGGRFTQRGHSNFQYGNKGRGAMGRTLPLDVPPHLHHMASSYGTMKPPGRYGSDGYGRGYMSDSRHSSYYDDYNGYNHHHGGGYDDKSSMSPWENGQPPGKNIYKRTLLPTPQTQRLSEDLVSSVNELFRMGGTEKQLLNIVQAVMETQEGINYRNMPYDNQGNFFTRKRGGYSSDHGFHQGGYYKPRYNSNYYYSDDLNQGYNYNGKYTSSYNNSNNKSKNYDSKTKSSPVLTKKPSSSKLSPKKTSELDKKEFENFPREALHCHICSISTFTSKESFITHLHGKSHALVAQVFHSKNSAILQMLRANSKIANMKKMAKIRRSGTAPIKTKTKPIKPKTTTVKTGVKGRHKFARSQSWSGETGKTVTCYKCMFDVSIPMKIHSKTMEHKQVRNFLSVKCCGKWYGQHNNGGRKEIEEHKLTFTHLLNEYNEKLQNEKGDSEDKGEDKSEDKSEEESNDEGSVAGSYLEQLQKIETDNGHTTLSNLPAYDSTLKSGVFCVKTRVVRYCRACKVQFGRKKNHLDLHCQSSEHYDNVVKLLQEEQEEQQEKKQEVTETEGNEDKVEVKEKDDQDESYDEAVEDLDSDDDTTESSLEQADDEDNCVSEPLHEKDDQEGDGEKSSSPVPDKVQMPVPWSDASEIEVPNGNVVAEE